MKMDENVITGPAVLPETLQITNQSFRNYLISVVKNHLDKILMVEAETGKFITFHDMLSNSFKLATFFQDNDCSKGSVVGIVSENSFDYPSLFMAIMHVGATCTCINPLYSTNELLHAFNISKPKLILTTSKNYSKIKEIQRNCDYLQHVIDIDEIDYNKLSEHIQDINNDKNKPSPTDTAVILYSSGTTGLSKGVMLTHKSFIYLMEIYRTEKLLEFPEGNIISGVLPMSHAYGLFALLSCLTLGHQYILINRYNEESFLSYIQKYKMKTLYIVPSIAIFLAKSPMVEKYDLSSVEIVSCGGGTLRPEVIEKITKLLSCTFLQHYGMTETTTMTLYSLPSSKAGVTGRLLPGLMAKIVDMETGSALGCYKTGEFCVKGFLLMKGYCGNTNDQSIDNDGWLHTGDIGYYDNDNNFYIVDRIKELIKYKGFQVPPAELEALLLHHEDIKEVGVVGLPDEVVGELPRAYIVKVPGSKLAEDEVLEYVANNISPMKKLRGGVKFVDQLPKTVSSKVDRKELKKWATAGI